MISGSLKGSWAALGNYSKPNLENLKCLQNFCLILNFRYLFLIKELENLIYNVMTIVGDAVLCHGNLLRE